MPNHLNPDGSVREDALPDDLWAANERAQARALAVVRCGLCDDDGYRELAVCDHVDHTEAARRGMAKVREVLNRKPTPSGLDEFHPDTTHNPDGAA